MSAPADRDSEQYRTWAQGARDEATARTEGLSKEALEVIECLDSLAKLHPAWTAEDLAAALAGIACPGRLKRRYRIKTPGKQ